MDKRQTVRNYVRLTELIAELMDYVDQKKIPITLAVDISYFDKQIQQWVYEYIKDNGFLKPVQIAALKEQPNLANTTQYHVISILNGALPQKSSSAKVSLSEKKLDQHSFYKISKLLFTDEYFKIVSVEAKVLYGLMVDRMTLSVKKQWFDGEGRAYIYYSLEDIMDALGCSNKKAITIMKELDAEAGIGLIEKKKFSIKVKVWQSVLV